MPIKHLSLQQWIQKLGTKKVAESLAVTHVTVRHWRCGYVLPKAEQMNEIRKLSRGQVTCDRMIASYFKKESNKGKHRK